MPLLIKNYFQRWRQENRGIAASSSSTVDKFNEPQIAVLSVSDRPTTSSNIGPVQHDGQRAVRHGRRFKTTIVPTGLINPMEYVNLDRRPGKNTLTNPCQVHGSKFEQKRSHKKRPRYI